ncbi:hypothetical protein ACFQY7_16775 [Actinomadura luteofluorescens]|uniref:hypothetical protein n=1 Tax=Actinomadura luteofluorescens TaxID=46163 RepID=UPI0036389990
MDKALTHPNLPPSDHDHPLDAALERTRHVKARYTPERLRDRATTAIRLAVGHGVGTLRAHVDVDPVGGLSALGVMADLRDRHRDLIDIQLVAFPQESIVRDPGALRLLREALTSGADVLGGAPDVEEPQDRLRHLDLLVELAAETGADLDVHCDYSYDPAQRDLEELARRTIDASLAAASEPATAAPWTPTTKRPPPRSSKQCSPPGSPSASARWATCCWWGTPPPARQGSGPSQVAARPWRHRRRRRRQHERHVVPVRPP